MRPIVARSFVALGCLALFLAGLMALDRARGGPATMLSRCSLLLARAERPAADVLIVGSSRSGVALDPMAIETMLQHDDPSAPSVERIAVGNATLRLSHALLDTYLETRGAPKIVVLEAAVMTQRSVTRLAARAGGKPPERFLFGRDINLMTFDQLLSQPSVAMPFTEPESQLLLWQLRLRGVALRAGALIYQFAKAPFEDWSFSRCDRNDITREATWPADFSFAYGDFEPKGGPSEIISNLETKVEALSKDRALKDWQVPVPKGRLYPYDFDQAYRAGEMAYLTAIFEKAKKAGAKVLVLPIPLYGYRIDPADTHMLQSVMDNVEVFDIYGALGVDFSKFWYDDAHLEKYPAGLLTAATMARRLAGMRTSEDHR